MRSLMVSPSFKRRAKPGTLVKEMLANKPIYKRKQQFGTTLEDMSLTRHFQNTFISLEAMKNQRVLIKK